LPPAARGSFEKREACPWTPQNFLLFVFLAFLQEAQLKPVKHPQKLLLFLLLAAVIGDFIESSRLIFFDFHVQL